MTDEPIFLDSSRTAPAVSAAAVTPGDLTTLSQATRALYIGVGGNVAAKVGNDATAVTFVGVPSGTILPIQTKNINSTSTTATSIVALF